MTSTLTANQLRGRAIGSLFFTGFGALWLALALYALERLDVIAGAALALVSAVLLLNISRLFAEARRWPRVPDDPAMGRAFGRINAIQWIAVFAVAFALAKLHLDAYIMNAITLIVGLHMFPLARVFRYPMHNKTGAVLVAWSILSIFIVPRDHLQGIAALGTGIILWIAAAIGLRLAFKTARNATPPQATKMPA